VKKNQKSERPRQIGLARSLSKLGHCSRSEGAILIRAGRVALNGMVRRNPEYPATTGDCITVDGRVLDAPARRYLVMNKPRGLVTTASDEKERPTVYSLLAANLPWVAPVGRLDQASEGLLLFTNDSEWAAAITAPESHIEKTYRVQITAVANEALITRLLEGLYDRGEHLRAVRATILRAGKKNSWVEVVLDEGHNRHIRRMFVAMGIEVLRLVRVAIGPLALGVLPKGKVRELTVGEKSALDSKLRH